MFRKKMFVVGLIFALLGLGAIFLWLNFKAARSMTKADQQVSTSSFGFEKGESVQAKEPLSVVVEGDDGLLNIVDRQIERNFLNGNQAGIILEKEVRTDIDHFQVVVDLKNNALIWTPFYARSQVEANFAFSSNGDLSWRDQDAIEFSSEQGQAVAVRGSIQLSDTTYGLISRPAYLSYLSEEIVVRVDKAIRKALANPTNPALITDP